MGVGVAGHGEAASHGRWQIASGSDHHGHETGNETETCNAMNKALETNILSNKLLLTGMIN